ncbi:class III signal peptide-containing protein [Methanobrevibacter sp.]|uniref:class III signal peptide-containing protein n=1 Tax=Methanobrevibacter sp. TaxID=66852 RepID=UPI00388DFD95
MKDNSAQISLEYLLIFALSLIILIVFTMPLLQESMDNTFDVYDSVNVKSDLAALAHAVMKVYGQGQGSKQEVTLTSNKDLKISIKNSYISTKIKLKNKDTKEIRMDVKSNLKSDTLYLKKGKNTLTVEWPDSESNMIIY